MSDARFFQRVFDEMTPLEKLPETAYPGDLAKTLDGTAWVWQNGWVKLDDAMRLVYNIQEPAE